MRNKFLIFFVEILCSIFLSYLISCNRKFEVPPAYIVPDISANTSISALKALHHPGGYEQISDDLIIRGIVVADDKSGNFYKTICIQDSTGGITLKLDAVNLYITYPVGREIFIKCKDLWLSDYGGLIQLCTMDKSVPANPSATGIPSVLLDNYIIKGRLGNPIVPKQVAISEFNDSLQSMLIQVKDSVQFIAADTAKQYADTSAAKNSVSRTVISCAGNRAIVYTSGYANFAGVQTPAGKGLLTAVYYVYKTTPELIIRDTSDARFKAARCGARDIKLAELKNLYKGADIFPGAYIISGIVISEPSNCSQGNIILQDGNSGISLFFGSAAPTSRFVPGDSIRVNITGAMLTSYKGMLQINLPAASLPATALATKKNIIPQDITIDQLFKNILLMENTLVRIPKVILSTDAGTQFSGNRTLTDASGTTNLYTAASAVFASNSLPVICQNIIGYANRFNSGQFQIRGMEDLTPASGCIVHYPFHAVYDFSAVTSSSGMTDPTAVPVSKNISFGSFTANGLSTNPTAASRFSFTGWPTGATNGSDDFTGNLNTAKYFEVTLTASAGFQLELASLSFILQRSATGVRQWTVRSSLDHFASNLKVSMETANNNILIQQGSLFQIADRAVTGAQSGCTLVFGDEFKQIKTAISFRFYGLNAETGSGTFSLNNVTITGTVN
jgi:hypothetical protein